MNKRQFTKFVCDTFNLGSITPSIFCYRVDCILMGMNLVKVPGIAGYKSFFSIYSLWRQTLKTCLDYPLFLQPIYDGKNIDYVFPEDMNENDVDRALHLYQSQIPFNHSADVSFIGLREFLQYSIAHDVNIKSNFVLQMKIYEVLYGIALYRDDKETANNICKAISDNIIRWDDKIFQYWYGDKAEYLIRLMDFDSNRINLLNNVSLNLAEPKIGKLPQFSFIF